LERQNVNSESSDNKDREDLIYNNQCVLIKQLSYIFKLNIVVVILLCSNSARRVINTIRSTQITNYPH